MDWKAEMENIGNFGKQIEEMANYQNKAFAQLPPEIYEKVKEHHMDMNKMIRDMKKGDLDSVNKLLNKYKNPL